MNPPNAAALAYVRFVLDATGLSPSGLAKQAGISSTTLTRPLNDQSYKFVLSTSTISKIAKATGINPGPFFKAKDSVDPSLAARHNPKVFDQRRWKVWSERSTVMIGEVAVGIWRELTLVNSTKANTLPLVSSMYSDDVCFAVTVADESVNRIARPGEILFCVKTEALDGPFVGSPVVVVERNSENERTIELSARLLTRELDGWHLTCPSDDPRYASDITIGAIPGDARARVVGVVQFVVRVPLEPPPVK
jgi:hypothetical protein